MRWKCVLKFIKVPEIHVGKSARFVDREEGRKIHIRLIRSKKGDGK